MAPDVERDFKPEPTRLSERVRRLPTIAHYLATLRAGWIIVTLTTVVGLLIGGWYASTVKPEFRGSTSAELPDVPVYIDLTNTGPPAKPTTIDTTGQLVFSEPVLQAAAKATGMPVEEINDNLSVSAYPLSRVIIVTLLAPTQEQAEDGANAATQELLVQRKAMLAGNRKKPARKMLQDIRGELDAHVAETGSYSTAILQIQQNIIRVVQENLSKYSNADGRIVNRAYPARKVSKHAELYVTTGAVTGFILGVLWLWWRPPKPRDPGGRGPGSAVPADDAVHELRKARHGRRETILVGSRVDPASG